VADADLTARRRALRDQVTIMAWDLGRAVREARTLNLPVEPGVREGRDALTHWAALLGELLPPPP
jgi:hypothetical protein